MFKVRVVHVPPMLVRGRVRRLVETPDGILLVQAWSGQGWQVEPSDLISPSEVRCGVDAPARILRALGVPESDCLTAPSSSQGAVSLLAVWPLIEWLASPASLSLLIAA